MKVLSSGTPEFKNALANLGKRRERLFSEYGTEVDIALGHYQQHREIALVDWARQHDEVTLKESDLWVDESHIKKAYKHVPSDVRKAIDHAVERVQRFQEELKLDSFSTQEEAGVYWGTQVRPLDRVGIYVPGGRANYFTTLILCAVPARTAGVKELIVATPPKARLEKPFVEPALLYAAKLLDIDKILVSGSVGALAALAYGTKNEAPVDKIVGSGNGRTAVAKVRLSAVVGTDGLTGPSETAFLCDSSSNVESVAADIIGRADRDPEAEIYVFQSDAKWLQKLVEELARALSQVRDDSSRTGAQQCLEKHTLIFKTKSINEGIELVNEIAPGVLCLVVDQAASYVSQIQKCGSILLGHFTPPVSIELVGGPSGTVPTLGSAAYSLSMSPASFVRRFTVMEFDQSALERFEQESVELSQEEGFHTHEASYRKRLPDGD